MEGYIRQYPSEYMWFYKIWKYSNQANVAILADETTGHLRQAQAVARTTQIALSERGIDSTERIISVEFKDKFTARLFRIFSVLTYPFVRQGKINFLKWFLTEKSLKEAHAMKADFIISCGSSIAGVNNLFAKDSNAKSIVILKPGLLSYNRFYLVI